MHVWAIEIQIIYLMLVWHKCLIDRFFITQYSTHILHQPPWQAQSIRTTTMMSLQRQMAPPISDVVHRFISPTISQNRQMESDLSQPLGMVRAHRHLPSNCRRTCGAIKEEVTFTLYTYTRMDLNRIGSYISYCFTTIVYIWITCF